MIIKNRNVVERKIHDSYFLIDISQNYLDDMCCLYEINEVGDFIWKQLEQTNDVYNVIDSLMLNLIDEVEYSNVYEDVLEFVNALVKEGFLEVVDGRN